MNEDLDNDFQKLYEKYKLARRKFCHDLEKLQRREENIRGYYTPRNVFNRWRDSIEGKKWKQNQYEKQQGKCACFGCAFVAQSPEYLEIDHIKPIATHPELSVNIKNLRLLCPPRNKRKGGR